MAGCYIIIVPLHWSPRNSVFCQAKVWMFELAGVAA